MRSRTRQLAPGLVALPGPRRAPFLGPAQALAEIVHQRPVVRGVGAEGLALRPGVGGDLGRRGAGRAPDGGGAGHGWPSRLDVRLALRPDVGQQGAGDDLAVDLACALPDLVDLHLAPVAGDVAPFDKAGPAVDLQGLIGRALGRFRGEDLGHAGLAGVGTPLVSQPGRLEHHGAGQLDLHGHVRQLELDGLELGDGPPELAPAPGVGDGRTRSRPGPGPRRGPPPPPARRPGWPGTAGTRPPAAPGGGPPGRCSPGRRGGAGPRPASPASRTGRPWCSPGRPGAPGWRTARGARPGGRRCGPSPSPRR